MTDEWRRKAYYDKRVLLDVADCLACSDPYQLVCLSGAQAQMIRNLCQYLNRRSTFVDEYHAGYYLAPDNDQWDEIQAIVADLEESLMSSLCDDLLTAIQSLATCVCALRDQAIRDSAQLPPLDGYVDVGLVTYDPEDETYPEDVPDPDDLIRCEYAQAVYYATYQMYSEHILPWANGTADSIVAAIVGAAAFAALATFIGFPVAILSGLVLTIVAWGVDGSIENFLNWMLGAKDEIICALYEGLPDEQAAAQAVQIVIDSASELSPLDKALLNAILGNRWFIAWVIRDQYENDTWDSYFVPGQCNDCDSPGTECLTLVPCVEGEWTSFSTDLVCFGGYPRCYPSIGYIAHTGGTLVAPRSTGNNLAVRVFGYGGPGPISVQVKIRNNQSPPMSETVIEDTVNNGQAKWLTGTFDTASPGEIHFIQVANSPYYVYVLAYCID